MDVVGRGVRIDGLDDRHYGALERIGQEWPAFPDLIQFYLVLRRILGS